MTVDRRAFIATAATLALAGAARAEDPAATPVAGDPGAPVWPPSDSLPLWVGAPPGTPATPPVPAPTMNGAAGHRELWIRGVATPMIHVFRPHRPNGAGLLAIPGGGYGFLSVQNEGLDVARFYNARGYTVFVLSYRLPGEGWTKRSDVPLQDAQRAMRLIRAGEYGVSRLGVIGFSAGGHLSASLALRSAMPVYTRVSPADGLDARPVIAAHMYPVVTMGAGAHPGSLDKLLGPNPSPQAVDSWSLEKHVTADAVPSFICLATDDTVVPPQPNGIALFRAMQEAKVASELQVFETGGHGFSLHWTQGRPNAIWPELFLNWAATHGFKA